jgi:transposase
MIKRRKHYTEEFKLEAVRLVKESGRTQEEIAGDLGIGKSTLGKWLHHYREEYLLAGPHEDKEKELKRLRRENELLRQERDLLKKATAFFAKETSR